MKFMRKTKDELDQSLLEEKQRHHFAPSSNLLKNTSSSNNTLETIIEEVPSYGQVIGYRFGRVSFGGFNPVVEENVQKGKWKPVRVHAEDEDNDSDVEVPASKRSKIVKQEALKDEPVYGSLIATCGKQFLSRTKVEDEDSDSVEEIDVELPSKKRGGWVTRGFRSDNFNMDRRNDSNSDKSKKKNKRPRLSPNKKARFMKPSDDF